MDRSIRDGDTEAFEQLFDEFARDPEAPVIYLTRNGTDSTATTYLDSFERVWSSTESSADAS
ncbi:hypothetical protein ACIBF6_09315 [Streptosporangium amethystogenes]|uniref:hypothetical protein n=1 Tax=Streptosporangium amethystogenes TaxID=2002 RepID=UPI0037BCA869